jgi:hypothetical protein
MRKILLLIAMFGVCTGAVLARPAMANWDPCKHFNNYYCQ